MRIIGVGLSMLVASCVNEEALKFHEQMASLRSQPVRVESDPPGAVIEIENEVRGRTPCAISIPALPNGNLLFGVEVKAIPTHPGDFTQKKLLLGGRPLPGLIFFNMHLGPVQPQINVHVDQ